MAEIKKWSEYGFFTNEARLAYSQTEANLAGCMEKPEQVEIWLVEILMNTLYRVQILDDYITQPKPQNFDVGSLTLKTNPTLH